MGLVTMEACSDISPDFLLRQVRRGSEKRYQQWFLARHMPRADAEGLVPDLVRYVCAVCHPPAPVRDRDSQVLPRFASCLLPTKMFVCFPYATGPNPIRVRD